MDTYAATTADNSEGLTLARFLAAYEQIEALLPLVHYHTSEYVQLAFSDGKPAVCWFNRMEHLGLFDIFDAPDNAVMLVICHPDNLPELQRQARGKCRLTPLVKERR